MDVPRNDGTTVIEKWPLALLWPWDILDLLHKQGRLESFISDHPDPSQRTKLYWQNSSHLDFTKDLDLSEPGRTIPLCWHTDGVQIYRNQKAHVYSFSSATCKGPTLSTKMIFCVVRDTMAVKPQTFDEIGALTKYMLKYLSLGVYPSVDEEGNEFAPGGRENKRAGQPFKFGWKGVFSTWKGDLEARVQQHKMLRNYMSTNICEHCLAGQVGLFPFRDFSPGASWRDTCLTHHQFLQLNPTDKQSVWAEIPGWRKERNVEDLLHLLHQGVAPRLARNRVTSFAICVVQFEQRWKHFDWLQMK